MQADTIDEVIDHLNRIIQDAKAQQNTTGYFAALYLKVTKNVKEKIEAGFFDDNPRMEKLDVVFANRYLQAHNDNKAGNPVTKSWEVAFDAATNQKLIVLQHLLAGMNAHINLDLGIAAAEITSPQSISSLQGDFNKINDVLAQLLAEVEKSLSEIWPTLLWLLKVFKRVDNFLINFSMTLARDGAWKFANEYVVLDPAQRQSALKDRDLKIAELGRAIVKPGRFVRFIFWVIRISEKGTVAQKIQALLN